MKHEPQNDLRNPAPRIPLSLEVGFRKSYARRDSKGQLKNISLTGAFLELEGLSIDDVTEKEKLLVKFLVSGRERSIAATVVWSNDKGCGIQFHPTNKRDSQIVDDLMYFVENSRESRKSVLDTIFKKVA